MDTLVGTIDLTWKNFYKNNSKIKEFFQNLIIKGELLAYDLEINKQIVEKDTEDEKIVRTIKGLTLIPINFIYPNNSDGSYFFEDPETLTKYHIAFDASSSESDFEPLENKDGHCDIIRLISVPSFNRITERSYKDPNIPEDMINGRLSYNWSDTIRGIPRDSIHHDSYSHLTIEGELDTLFNKTSKFIEKP